MVGVVNTIFSWAPKSLQVVTAAMKLKDAAIWKKSYDQPRQHILKSRDITLPTKVYLVKAMVFPVVMYGCESWTMRKAEHQRIDAFFFSFIFISWRLITLQYCSGICHTLT